MDISFEGYASQAVTFYAGGDVAEGDPVMLGDDMTVYKAAENADIIGVALAVKEGYVTVQTSGAVKLPASDFLTVGYSPLTVDGEGKLTGGETGPDRLVIYIDGATETATVLL